MVWQASLLISEEIDIECVRTVDYFTPLMAAASFGHVSVVNTLIKQGANVNYKRPEPLQDTCLMRACKFNRIGVVDVLLRTIGSGAEDADLASTTHLHCRINERDSEQRTALMLAIMMNAKDAVRALLRAGADINAVDNLGYSALMHVRHLRLTLTRHRPQIVGGWLETVCNCLGPARHASTD